MRVRVFFPIKYLHISCAVLSIALFVWRGGVLLATNQRVSQRWLHWFPHLVDTLLLASGITLAFIIHQYPGVDAWLTAKVVALIVYIALGVVTMRVARIRPARSIAFTASVVTFACIVGVAVAQDPISWPAIG